VDILRACSFGLFHEGAGKPLGEPPERRNRENRDEPHHQPHLDHALAGAATPKDP
jgi:hypothetical protein